MVFSPIRVLDTSPHLTLALTQNPNFIEILGLVDAGIGLGFKPWEHNGMKFESWHRTAKGHARQGCGVQSLDTHVFHERLTDKSVLAMDATLTTLGRIPMTRAMRAACPLVPQAVFDQRYHRRLLGPKHGSQPASELKIHKADAHKKSALRAGEGCQGRCTVRRHHSDKNRSKILVFSPYTMYLFFNMF